MPALYWVWCFPQMLVGFLVKLITKAEKHTDHYRFKIPFGSVSLGEYIFLCHAHCNDTTVLRHEQGHRTQSRMLGWLYLPIIGIPSLIWAWCYQKRRTTQNVSYYDFYTEKWADKLGGITRD